MFGRTALAAIDAADVLIGALRHLSRFVPADPRRVDIELTGALPPLIEQIADHRERGLSVCVLSSGDPGFFGITRLLVARFGSEAVQIHPAPSSVSLAFAAAGLTWDDAAVVSAHGRAMTDAVDAALGRAKVAVLTAPSNPPEILGAALVAAGCGARQVVVASRLGESDERIVRTDLAGLAAGHFDPMSVVLLQAEPDNEVAGPTISWGRDEATFARRSGMITKAEVRAIALSKLHLPRLGVLWDVGAGSGSVGVEAATIAPAMRVYAVERAAADAANITDNAVAAGVDVDVVIGEAPGCLASLPDPDRAFVGGGGLDVVEACWNRLRPTGWLVATFVVIDRAVAARALLGEMVQVQVNRCVPIGDAGVRLDPLNPVFICWGQK